MGSFKKNRLESVREMKKDAEGLSEQGSEIIGNASDIHSLLEGIHVQDSDDIESVRHTKKGNFVPVISGSGHDNLLVVCRDEKMAVSIFDMSIMSVLLDGAGNGKALGSTVYIADLSDDSSVPDECPIGHFAEVFPDEVSATGIGKIEDMIDTLYERLLDRSDGSESSKDRIFFMFFGINRARRIMHSGIYDGDDDEKSTQEKLIDILSKGPKCGISSIFWSEDINGPEEIIGARYGELFDRRIAYGLDEKEMHTLVDENDARAISGRTAVYRDFINDVKNIHFRPYDIPSTRWVDEFASAYRKAQEGGSRL